MNTGLHRDPPSYVKTAVYCSISTTLLYLSAHESYPDLVSVLRGGAPLPTLQTRNVLSSSTPADPPNNQSFFLNSVSFVCVHKQACLYMFMCACVCT